ncbi:hypothetical protein C2845_PM13G06580 [Panicum miliaceum]|uniref:F-box domain-containing protein n=1 Tax=Panicum miliaceum TaxID=4540 RepID=A0A3L6RL44_PANMI|nr:hypothetical protein C2845_PM13G06580 [Panicum miliaceum]
MMMENDEPRDFLSELPTDVLVSILENVDLLDAVRAGILSRRWRRLTSQLPRLVLRMEDFLPTDVDEHRYYDDGGGGVRSDDGRPRDALSDASDAMLQAAAALLASRLAEAPACTVAMRFLLRHNYMSLGRLLDGVVAGGKVRAVELSVSTTCSLYESGKAPETYRAMAGLGRRFMTTLFDGCPAAFGGLTRLALEDMYLRRPDDLSDILSTCTKLEVLSLLVSGVSSRKQPWTVRHAQLTDVSISFCSFYGVDLAWLPKLERFSYKQWDDFIDKQRREPLSFGHVPRLKTLILSNTLLLGHRALRLSQILANTAVSDLRLNFRGQDLDDVEERFLPTKKTNVLWEVPAGFKHYTLARLTILGFYDTGSEGIVHFLRSLVQAAVHLEEMHVREKAHCDECDVTEIGPPSFPRTDQDKDALRERISGGRSTAFKIYIQPCTLSNGH